MTETVGNGEMLRLPIPLDTPGMPESGYTGRPLGAEVVALGRPDTAIFMGIGNEGRCLTRMARLLLGQGIDDVAIVGGLPYDKVPATREGLQGLAKAGALAVGHYVHSNFQPERLHGIAESQAAPSLVYAALQEPEVFSGRIGLMQPIGIVHLTRWQYADRMTRGTFQPEHLFDRHTLPIAANAGHRTFQDLARGGERLQLGLTTDIRDELVTLAARKGDDIRVVAGSRDLVFPPATLHKELAALGLERLLWEQDGAHSSPAVRAGARHAAEVIRWCRS